MAHEIKQHDKQQGRSMAWHSLTEVTPDLNLENSWLQSWDYVSKPVQVDGKRTGFAVLGVTDDCQVEIEGLDGTVPLTIGRPYAVKTFKPVTNKVMLEKLGRAIEKENLLLESCGSVHNRGRTFLSFSFAGANFNAANRPFRSFLNIGNGNDMSSPLWANTSNTCTVCDNTFNLNLSTLGKIMTVKKTQYSEFKISEMGKAIAAMLAGQKEFAAQLNELAGIACNEHTAEAFLAGFNCDNVNEPLSTRAFNNTAKQLALFKSGTGNGNKGMDWSDVFSALTDWFTHFAASAKSDQTARWKNFVSSEFGSGSKAKQEAWARLTDTKKRKEMVAIGNNVLRLTAQAVKKGA